MNAAAPVPERWVGPDLVRIEGEVLAIYSRRDMPDWVVREFCRPAIWFQEQKFFLLARERVRKPLRWRYSLSPWPTDDRQSPPYSIRYSPDYVSGRERDHRQRLTSASVSFLLRPIGPLLGFLWSGTKDRLAFLGFPANSVTSASVAVEFGVFVLLGLFIGYLGYWSARNVIVLVALAVDLVMRYDALLGDNHRQPGFFEWCFRR